MKLNTYKYLAQLQPNGGFAFAGSDTNYYTNNKLVERRTFKFDTYWWRRVQHTFSYDQNGRVSKVETRDWHYGIGDWDTVKIYYTFEYGTNTIVQKEVVKFQPSPWNTSIKTYHLNAEGKPESYGMPAVNNSNAIDSGYYTYQYGNLVEFKKRLVNWSGQGRVEETVTTYSGYDNRKNPLKGYYYLTGLFEEAWSENNYTSIQIFGQEYLNGVVVHQSQTLKTYSPWYFTYNSDGYPTTKHTPLGVAYDYYTYQ